MDIGKPIAVIRIEPLQLPIPTQAKTPRPVTAREPSKPTV